MKVNDDYIKRFPISLQKCLQNSENRTQFENTIVTDYEDRLVYRGIVNPMEITPDDFLNNEDSYSSEGKTVSKKQKERLDFHSVSVHENLTELKKSLSFPPGKHIKGFAKGNMRAKNGPADAMNTHRHHNWYLFDGANTEVYKEFEIIPV